ncbi:unannotated protein [freshwater metagenome]|uniref:Unannotated protein n=1 Tax=freshwater metagenome TaxID=449393 RepID=A0A6J7GIK8_9ZZZZ
MHRDAVENVALSLQFDADLLANRATTIGAKQILGANRVLLARLDHPNNGCHAVVVLSQLHQLMPKANRAGRLRLGVLQQDGLEANLWQVCLPAGARDQPVGIGATRAPRLLLRDEATEVGVVTGEPGIPRSGGHVLRRGAGSINVIGHTCPAIELHGALLQHVCLRQNRGRRRIRDGERCHAEITEQHRCGQSGTPGADNEDGNFDIRRHGSPLSS